MDERIQILLIFPIRIGNCIANHHANNGDASEFDFMNDLHKNTLALILRNCPNMGEYQYPP